MSTTVYGASDDLIEVTGPVGEEFNHYDAGEPAYLGFSNGVVLSVTYQQDGMWWIRPRAGHDLVTIDPALGEDANRREDGSSGYSDRATIAGDVTWVVVGDRCEVTR